MSKKQKNQGSNPKLVNERRKAREQREALLSYVLIAFVVGLILYGLYLQHLHHY